MGLDGFSMGNLGLNTELTSAQITSQAEQFAQKEAKIEVKTISESAKDEGVKRKEEDEESGNQNSFLNDDSKKEEEEETNQNTDFKTLNEKEFNQEELKEISVRINPKTEHIELVNKDKTVIETITAQDLMNIISRLNNASGVLVNRKI